MIQFGEKETLGLWWDSKVPEKDKVEWSQFWAMPYQNINWSGVSDKDEVIKDVKAFFEFYQEIEALAQEINEIVTERGIGAAEPEINCLSEKLKAAIRNAEEEKDTVNSSAIYHSHHSLISAQSKMVSKLASAHLQASREKSRELEKKLEKSEDLSAEYRKLYDGSEKRNQELAQDNKEIKQSLEAFKEQVTTFMRNVTIEGGKSHYK